MKKSILCFAILLMLGIFASAHALSVQTYGVTYAPAVQTTTALASSAVTTVYSDTGDRSIFLDRIFALNNKGPYAISATIEASMDLTTWTTVDAASLAYCTATKESYAKVNDNCMPYWRVRAISVGTIEPTATQVYAIMITR